MAVNTIASLTTSLSTTLPAMTTGSLSLGNASILLNSTVPAFNATDISALSNGTLAMSNSSDFAPVTVTVVPSASAATGTSAPALYPEGVSCTGWAGEVGDLKTSFLDFGLGLCDRLANRNASYVYGWMGSGVDGFVVGADYPRSDNITFVLFAPDTNTGGDNCTAAVASIAHACMGDATRMFDTGVFDYADAASGHAERYMFGWTTGLRAADLEDIALQSYEDAAAAAQEAADAEAQAEIERLQDELDADRHEDDYYYGHAEDEDEDEDEYHYNYRHRYGDGPRRFRTANY